MLKAGVVLAGRYEIVGRIGSGGMADVYKAMDRKLNRYVAVKVMKPEFQSDSTFISKFRREAQAAAGLANPNIVNVYDVERVDVLKDANMYGAKGGNGAILVTTKRGARR